MKKVGIIGGFGPETTSEFMLMLISMWKKRRPDTRPGLLIWNSPMEENIEKNFILNNKSHPQMLRTVLDGAKILENSGVDFLVLPCNSLHIFIDELRNVIEIPILSILDITTSHLIKNNISDIGILGTKVTINSNMFSSTFSEKGINTIIPSTKNQIKINNLIQKLVTDKSDKLTNLKVFRNCITDMKEQKVNNFLLACTDLQLIQPHNEDAGFIDTLHLLAEATIDTMLQE